MAPGRNNLKVVRVSYLDADQFRRRNDRVGKAQHSSSENLASRERTVRWGARECTILTYHIEISSLAAFRRDETALFGLEPRTESATEDDAVPIVRNICAAQHACRTSSTIDQSAYKRADIREPERTLANCHGRPPLVIGRRAHVQATVAILNDRRRARRWNSCGVNVDSRASCVTTFFE